MKIRSLAAWAAVAVLSLALADCSALKGSVPTPSTPSTCAVPSGVQTQLLYPIPGATAVPDSPGQVVFAISSPLPTWGVALQGGGGSGFGAAFTTITAAQVPSPSATPSFANPIYVSSSLSFSLPSATAVGVYLNDLSSNCTPLFTGATFTTQ